MTRKAQAFQSVAEALKLDSNGFHEVAFAKYLDCLQMLSSFLVDQFSVNGIDKSDDNGKNEAQQVLSVIRDCTDRASSILKSEVSSKFPMSVIRKSNSFGCLTSVPDVVSYSISTGPRETRSLSISFSSGIAAGNSISCSSASANDLSGFASRDRSPISRAVAESRHPTFPKVEHENAVILKKYQVRIENARNKYAQQNLQLELQRRLAENLTIARAKYTQIVKRQQEEKARALECAIRNLLISGPCLNAAEQEKRELYLEVLHFETSQTKQMNLEYMMIDRSPSEVIETIFQRAFRYSSHPLSKWLAMVHVRLKKRLSMLLVQYSDISSLLPGQICIKGARSSSEITDECDISLIPDCDTRIQELQKTLETIAGEVKNTNNTIMEIIYTVYKSHLPLETDTICYRLTERTVLSPLWFFFISLCRIANIQSEMKIAVTMQNCQKYSHDFNIPPMIFNDPEEAYKYGIQQLKRIPSLLSLVGKLSVLVHLLQNLCQNGSQSSSESRDGGGEKFIGADELVPVLCYILVQSGMPQLVSECYALELLMDSKYMLGEEGYALSSFQTALSYLEMKKLIDHEDLENSPENTNQDLEL